MVVYREPNFGETVFEELSILQFDAAGFVRGHQKRQDRVTGLGRRQIRVGVVDEGSASLNDDLFDLSGQLAKKLVYRFLRKGDLQ